jgi:hypothetical protein
MIIQGRLFADPRQGAAGDGGGIGERAMFGHKKGLERKLRDQGGTVAWATILIAEEKWRSARGGDTGFGGPSAITDHMKLTLRVEPEGAPTFEVTFKQAFPGPMPRAGGRAKVIFDAADHSRIAVIDGEVYMPGVSVEKQQRARAHVAEAMEAANSGNMAEYIERRKAEVMRAAADGTAAFVVSGGGARKVDVVDELAKLADLRDRGALTEAEFAAQKAKLLAAD